MALLRRSTPSGDISAHLRAVHCTPRRKAATTTTTYRPAPRAAASARPLDFGERVCSAPSAAFLRVLFSPSLCASRACVTRARKRSTLDNSQPSRQRRSESERASELQRGSEKLGLCRLFFFLSPPSPFPLPTPSLVCLSKHAHTHTHTRSNFPPLHGRGDKSLPFFVKSSKARGERE